MSRDPRIRGDVYPNGTSTTPSERKQSILFGDADEEDVMDIDEEMQTTINDATTKAIDSTSHSVAGNYDLISTIISPSPYPHHNSGPTSSRFRNALNRVTAAPESDVEAWQALITEANACYRNITNIHAVDAETFPKLDWIESCYGSLLKSFPYASTQYVAIAEMLFAQSARTGEDNGPLSDFGMDVPRRSILCEAKLEYIFRRILGVELDGTVLEDSIKNGMCIWVVDLWLLFIRKVERDAKRRASTIHPDDREATVRDAVTKAYESAISQAGFSHNNHLIWKKYIEFVKSWAPVSNKDHAFGQHQMLHLRSVYQRLVTYPMTGLDQLWQEYESFERAQSEALAQALISEYSPKYQNARMCYLERNRVYGSADLQLGRLATPPVEESEEDYMVKIEEEYAFLKLWKTRCSYERTNPLRLELPEQSKRIRHIFKEMVCVLTRHPECWHMWSTWELFGSESTGRKAEKATAVLQLAQQHIKDCTLLALFEAQIIEQHTDRKEDSMKVMETFLSRSPNTLGFVLYQQMVRRYKGKDAARLVFSRARRILTTDSAAAELSGDKNKITGITQAGDVDTVEKVRGVSRKDENSLRSMVTNRLDSTIGMKSLSEVNDESESNGNAKPRLPADSKFNSLSPGQISWHLYSAHAVMEHRLNRCADIAARVYELGLRKHVTFITTPPYVLRYARLLLELNDVMNLRALLTRAVAACEAKNNKNSLSAMWDMRLYFESVISGSDASSVVSIQSIERRRHEALMGPEVEDVGTGGFIGVDDTALIGAQKSTISEQLVRAEGYDISSRIVNGMSRTVDFLGVVGLWGDGESDETRNRVRAKYSAANKDAGELTSGGKSDKSYRKRLKYQLLVHSGLASDVTLMEGSSGPGSKSLSARERLQQGAGATIAGPGQGTAIMLAIQQSPEWLRALLLLLPASKLRLPIVAKPPPHLTELALNALRQNNLPSERPADSTADASKRALSGADGNSSDEDDDGAAGSGYSNAFRARQRARIMRNGAN